MVKEEKEEEEEEERPSLPLSQLPRNCWTRRRGREEGRLGEKRRVIPFSACPPWDLPTRGPPLTLMKTRCRTCLDRKEGGVSAEEEGGEAQEGRTMKGVEKSSGEEML